MSLNEDFPVTLLAEKKYELRSMQPDPHNHLTLLGYISHPSKSVIYKASTRLTPIFLE
ncbi:MAG: hypothetical protein IPJ39_16835 [Saprospiraceae bacterium]|nr:hypothetical protein [Saprospiraceae bacterium]